MPRRRVTFSRNLTLSLSRTCRCYCKYCAFATHQAHLHAPDEVLALLDGAARRSVKELLVLTGERPEVNPEVARAPAGLGPRGLHRLRRVDVRARARARPAAAHEPRRARPRRPGPPARGHGLAGADARVSVNPDLVVHQGSPTKHPARRLETIAAAGELRIPFTSGILVGIGESEDERVAALEALAEVHAEHGHLQEVILQNFVPAPPLLRRGAGRDRRRAARAVLAHRRLRTRPTATLPEWATAGVDRGDEAADRRGAAAAARRRHPGAAEPRRLVAASSSPPARPTSAGCRPTATTSRPSTRSRARTRCASAWQPTASR